ncbi:hypothetical protein BU16DRAFT_540194 [Lophium mytilinum]|uniref:Uncharacterized protein n=1 Tax=Lophium mytilinum TaxID=390894 RepID=A0A6A6QS46_9PEZI|nr:hypothetical protein BU16DRAFT_540194 [Lophium mytilinum]
MPTKKAMTPHIQDDSTTEEPFAVFFKGVALALTINSFLAHMFALIALNPIIGHLEVVIFFHILLLLIALVFNYFQPEDTAENSQAADSHDGAINEDEPIIGRLLYAGLWLSGTNAALNTIRTFNLLPLSVLLMASFLVMAEAAPRLQSEGSAQQAETVLLDDSAEWKLASETLKIDMEAICTKFASYLPLLHSSIPSTISSIAARIGPFTCSLSYKDEAPESTTGTTRATEGIMNGETQALQPGAEAPRPSSTLNPTSASSTPPTSVDTKPLELFTESFKEKLNRKEAIEDFRKLLGAPPIATTAQVKRIVKALNGKIQVDRELMKDEEKADELQKLIACTSYLLKEPLELVIVRKRLTPRPLGPGVNKIGGRRRNRH